MKTKCEYCTFDDQGNGKWWGLKADNCKFIHHTLDDEYLCIRNIGNYLYAEPINKCPQCGRKLNRGLDMNKFDIVNFGCAVTCITVLVLLIWKVSTM